MTLLVTGGAGYIGSHTVRALQQAGHRPVVLDNLVYGHRSIVEEVLRVPLVQGQVGDRALIEALLSGRHPACGGVPVRAVLHFAAYAYVGESVLDPAKYYRNNLGDTLTLLEALVEPVRTGQGPAIPIVFSSTCATYGSPETVPITEDTPAADQFLWTQQVDGGADAGRFRGRLWAAQRDLPLFQCGRR